MKNQKGEGFLLPVNASEIIQRMSSIASSVDVMQTPPAQGFLIQSMMQGFFTEKIRVNDEKAKRESKESISADDTQKLHTIKKFIEQHFLDELTLTGLCREAGLNEFKLKKGFRHLFGTSVIQYVRQLRMEYAQALLRDSNMLIEEVSSQLGYRYPNHFSTAYKRHFGVVPSKVMIK